GDILVAQARRNDARVGPALCNTKRSELPLGQEERIQSHFAIALQTAQQIKQPAVDNPVIPEIEVLVLEVVPSCRPSLQSLESVPVVAHPME
ncbi:MAG: hypothetical protein SGPRY_007481, partial [Prymnesium sp.]